MEQEQRTIDEILKSAPDGVTGRQLRAARMLAGLSRLELAKVAGLSEGTIITLEQRDSEPAFASCQLETKLYVIDALWRAGVRLLDNEGVERRGDGE